VKDFVYVTDKAYSEDDVIKMESLMLIVLEFKVCQPTAYTFFQRYQSVNGCTEAHSDLALYLLELTLAEYRMLKYSPSHLAAAAILLSNKLLKRHPCWTPAAVKYTNSTELTLKECVKDICALLEGAEKSSLQAVRKKFSQQKHHVVARLGLQGYPELIEDGRSAKRPMTAQAASSVTAATALAQAAAPLTARRAGTTESLERAPL
jgi:hypothetical protein